VLLLDFEAVFEEEDENEEEEDAGGLTRVRGVAEDPVRSCGAKSS